MLAHEGRILLLRRAIDPFLGCWDIPGGFCEGGEHPRAAAERELFEEVGVRAEATRLLGVWIDSYGPPTPDGEQPTTLNLYYLLEPTEGAVEPRLDRSENSELGWFGPDGIPEPLAFPGHIPFVLEAWRRSVRGERLEPGLELQAQPSRRAGSRPRRSPTPSRP